MKDAARDELELRLFGVLMNDEGAIPVKVLETITEALAYVQLNPSISQVMREIKQLSDELDDHENTLSVMEKLS